MKSSLKVGITGQLSTRVGPGNTITLGDDAGATVFSTPSMIQLMELAAREAIIPHLDRGEDSVGVDVQIAHSSATPPRAEVTAEAVATAIEKNVISFDVVARDSWGEVGRGTHRRAVIETAKFSQRLAQRKPAAASPSVTSDSMPSLKTIDCHRSGGLLRMTLNRPHKRNAISAEMTGEMEQLVDWLAGGNSGIRVVLVSGAAETFCTGDDVGDLPESTQQAGQLSLRRGALYQRITELDQVFIAAIDGLALGGGLVLAASCDFRVATHRAKLGLPEVLLGWPPNYGMGILESLIGRGRTLELALGGKTIEARRAAEIGLVHRVVSQAQLDVTANQIADEVLAVSPDAISATKRLLAAGTAWNDEAASAEFERCLQTERARSSIARFR